MFQGRCDEMLKSLALLCFVTLSCAACSYALHLEVYNAGPRAVKITVEPERAMVEPGLAFKIVYPEVADGAIIEVSDGICQYEYAVPNLDEKPWVYLVGQSFKLRWLGDGQLEAYPPTPDVNLPSNPARNIEKSQLTLPVQSKSCL